LALKSICPFDNLPWLVRETFHKIDTPEFMASSFFPVLLLIGFVAANAVAIIGLSHLTLRLRPTPEKDTAYESGIPPLGDARERFSVKFYMVAMLFIVFDIETVFMIPWGVAFRQLSCTVPLVTGLCPSGHATLFGLGEMLVFIAILLAGLVYVWKKGALQWD
jgi:NADH-quinone oxidoreductase subunit A